LPQLLPELECQIVEEVYFVLGATAEKIKGQILNYSIHIIEIKNWQQGIGSSIACALAYCKENKLVFNSVQLPWSINL